MTVSCLSSSFDWKQTLRFSKVSYMVVCFFSFHLILFSVQPCCTSCSRLASWWMKEFPLYFCNCSPVPCVAVRCWPPLPPPRHHSQVEAPVVLDRQEPLSPLRASPLVKRAKRRTERRTKRVRLQHTFSNIIQVLLV